MDQGRRKFIEDAAKVIDGRVAALKAELERDVARHRFMPPARKRTYSSTDIPAIVADALIRPSGV